MNPNEHFDVDGAIDALRRNMTQTAERGLSLAPTENDRVLVRTQARLDEAALALHRWMLEMHNEHLPVRVRVQALGAVLGNVLATFGVNTPDDEDPASVISDVIMHALTTSRAHLCQEEVPNSISHTTTVTPVQGGAA